MDAANSFKVHYISPSSSVAERSDAETDLVESDNRSEQRFYIKNENIHPQPETTTAVSAAAVSDTTNYQLTQLPPLPPAPQHYDLPTSSVPYHQQNAYDPGMQQQLQHTFVGNGNAGVNFPLAADRYHPYFKPQFQEFPDPSSSHLQFVPTASYRCDKCSFQCYSQEIIARHVCMFHGSQTALSCFGSAHHRQELNGVAEQAKIFDLDSQRVQVYQPPVLAAPQTEDLWREGRRYAQQPLMFQPRPMVQNGTPAAGERRQTPLHSPDFGSVSTTTNDAADIQTPSPCYEANRSRPAQISSTAKNGRGKSSSSKSGSGPEINCGTPKPTNGVCHRAKTYLCSTCNKWFTSSGHLKRHYNTTLHKNAVTSSNVVDPATQPISLHHFPERDPEYPVPPPAKHRKVQRSPNPRPQPANGFAADVEPNSNFSSSNQVSQSSHTDIEAVVKSEARSHYEQSGYASPSPKTDTPPLVTEPKVMEYENYEYTEHPNLITGPSEVPEGLRQHHQSPRKPLDLHMTVPPAAVQIPTEQIDYAAGPNQPQFIRPPANTPTTNYPNFQSPYVSTTNQIILLDTSPIGELVIDENVKLPSFACIQKNVAWKTEAMVDGESVGGEVTSGVQIKSERCESSDESGESHCEPESSEDSQVSSSTENIVRATPSPDSKSPRKSYECDACKKSFSNACYLTQHNKSFHSGYKPYKCEKCGKRFGTVTSYKSHLEKHAGDKPHKCDICPKAFNHKTDLRRHLCVHSDCKPHICNICTKRFIRKDHMLKHRDTHQNRNAAKKMVAVKIEKKLNTSDAEAVPS